ncbi:MAG: hypothetical protein J6D27_02085 [Ruminiclostridium sp.]|nr:hypothetical protein [Ruminiclostridium sp.]
MKRILYTFFQLVWGLPQSLAGFIIFLFNIKRSYFIYHGAVVTKWKLSSSVSLGLFIFVSENYPAHYENGRLVYTKEEMSGRLLVHEYGHTIQSLIFGPLYLVVIGLPSFIWAGLPPCRNLRCRKHIPYTVFFTERFANYLGEKVTKEKSLERIFRG